MLPRITIPTSRKLIAEFSRMKVSRATPEPPADPPPPAGDDASASAGAPGKAVLPGQLAHFPAARSGLRTAVVFSPSGGQGSALAAQALSNAHDGNFNVILKPRSEDTLQQNQPVKCGERTMYLTSHPHAQVCTAALPLDTADTLVFNATVVGGLPDTIAQTPPGSQVFYVQNGLDRYRQEKAEAGHEAHTLISMTTSTRQSGRGVTVTPGGTVLADENDPLIDSLHRVLGGRHFFTLQTVPDIEATRYEKIALNCALNITATVFGMTLGEIDQLLRRDGRCGKLIAGLAAEVCALARDRGIGIKPVDRLLDDIHAVMQRFPGHPTSMRAAFDAGLPTEVAVLNEGIAAEARRHGIAAPLNALMAEKLAGFEARRAADGVAEGFHRRHPELVRRTIEELLQAADRHA